MNRKLALVGLVSFSIFCACGEEARPIPLPTTELAPPPPPASPASPPSDAAPAAPATPDVADVLGNVVDDAGDPVVGREVVVIDRAGRRERVLTDEGGTFGVRAVAVPYDVKVGPAPSGTRILPAVWLGLYRSDPRLVVVEHEGAVARPPAQRLKVVLNVKTCPTEACWVSVTSTSRSGAGAAGRTVALRETLAVVEIDHVWTKAEVPTHEPIEIAALVGDEGYSHLAFARATTLARPGEEAVLGLAPQLVEVTEPVSIAASAEGAPSGHETWAFTLATRLVLPGGTAIGLHYVEGPALVTRLPRIEGARLEVDAWANARSSTAPRSSFARSGPVALGTPSVTLALPRELELVRPGEHGRISRRGRGFAWLAPAPLPRVTAITLENAAGRALVRVVTDGKEVPFGRLRRLGVPAFDLGDHVLDLATTTDRTLDDDVAPEGATGASGTQTPWGTTHQRARFQIVR